MGTGNGAPHSRFALGRFYWNTASMHSSLIECS